LQVGKKIRLYPTKEQEQLFWKYSGTARWCYNTVLAYKISRYKELGKNTSIQECIDYIQGLKYNNSDYVWVKEVPESVTKQAIKDLDKAYKSFFKSGFGFPKYKKKGKSKPSFYQRTDKFRQVDNTHIKITGIKDYVKIRPFSFPSKIANPRVNFDGKYWYLSFSFEIQETAPTGQGTIGIDLGIKNLATCSNGKVYENINKTKVIKQLQKRKKRLQRQVSRKYEMNKRGKRFKKTQNIKKLEQKILLIDRRIKNIRDTYIHTVTKEIVKTKPSCVVIEDLNVSGMMKNKNLSKAIQEQELYKFRQYITYKGKAYGFKVRVANRYFPSSKLCSRCGYLKKDLKLSDRIYICPICGLVIDRDLNASINLQNYYDKKGESLLVS
jgi:putative transposase